MKILMVCLGNICRSPLAEGILQQKANEQGLHWVVESAGTNGIHNGEPPHKLSQKVALQNGVDISTQVSRKFVVTDIAHYDKIYVMAENVMEEVKKIAGAKFDESKIAYFLDEPIINKNKNVPDPWYGNEDGYEKVYKIINETCNAILAKYK